MIIGSPDNPILVIAPHADDAELGCGATIARLADADHKIIILTLTDRDGNLPWHPGYDTVGGEPERAAGILAGASNQIQVVHCDFPIFDFHSVRQNILTRFERVRDTFKPGLVFVPSAGDLHQDHQVAYAEACRAFKGVTLLTYEIVRSNFDQCHQCFVAVTSQQVQRKVGAVACYTTQAGKRYCHEEVIEGLARLRGAMCGTEFAEAFGVRWIVV